MTARRNAVGRARYRLGSEPDRSPAGGRIRPRRGLRRELGAVAWSALEVLALAAELTGDGQLIATLNARQVAAALGVGRDAAANALALLRRRGLIVVEQSRRAGGHFTCDALRDPDRHGERVRASPISRQATERHASAPTLFDTSTTDTDHDAAHATNATRRLAHHRNRSSRKFHTHLHSPMPRTSSRTVRRVEHREARVTARRTTTCTRSRRAWRTTTSVAAKRRAVGSGRLAGRARSRRVESPATTSARSWRAVTRSAETGLSRTRHRRVPGFDLTFCAPKSVSVLWGLGDWDTAREVRAAHDTAVDAALGYLETEACWSRRGTNGVDAGAR